MNTVNVAVTKPVERLFSPFHVALATFFGTPAAGGFLLWINFKRLNQHDSAVRMLMAGFGLTVALIFIGFILPERFPSTPFAIAGLVAMRALAQQQQGSALEAHLKQEGELESAWAAVGIGLAFLIGLFVFLTAVILALGAY